MALVWQGESRQRLHNVAPRAWNEGLMKEVMKCKRGEKQQPASPPAFPAPRLVEERSRLSLLVSLASRLADSASMSLRARDAAQELGF